MRPIDADALTEDCKRYLGTLNPDRDGKECTRIHWLIGVLANASTIEERKTGKWLTSDDMYETGICSVCKWDSQEPVSYTITMFKYCPNCSARMIQEGEEK